ESSAAMSADLITLSAKVVDSEAVDHNDSATATAPIGNAFFFLDDGPSIGTVPDGTVLSTNVGADPTTGNGSFTASAGNDGPSSGFVQIYQYATITGLTPSLNTAHTVLTYSDGATPVYQLSV